MQLFDDVMNLRCSFSGRGLWQYGTTTVKELGSSSLCNCYGVVVDNIDAFLFTFDMLMLGGGVGFNIQKEHVFSLPKVLQGRVIRRDTNDAEFIVPDSREGWVELLARVLESYFETGKPFSFSTVCIRPKGSPIAGFGGTASGAGPLCQGIQQICTVLDNRVGKKLRPIDCYDIMCIIGSIVVAGNVRRSALLALGDHEDNHYLLAKRFDLQAAVPNWRAMANNSVACSTFSHLPDKFWKTFETGGEPLGLVNLNLMREKGRLKDNHRKDPNVMVTNPCSEISLESGESCNLAELFLPNISDVNELVAVATRLFKVTKVVASVPHHWEMSRNVIDKNLRTGVGVTGVMQVLNDHFDGGLESALDATYKAIEDTDAAFSKELGERLGRNLSESIKLTTVKPSGTLSLLAGTTPGVHPEYAPFYIRRIRVASDSPIVQAAKDCGLIVESVIRFDGSRDPSTNVIEFPVKAREGSIFAKDVTAIRQLETVKLLQTFWSDNSVSVTVYYRKEELPEIKNWLAENYDNSVKAVSFLLHSEHGFAQAPYEEISEKEYLRRIKGLKPIDLSSSHDEQYNQEDCATGACPIR
jgi:adenosylcobalamin-dependent ribonucleoside-triphosphate reductase